MTSLANALRVLLHLFVDDGSLALAIVAVVMLSAGLAALMPDRPLLVGIALLGGCLAILLANVMRAAQKRS